MTIKKIIFLILIAIAIAPLLYFLGYRQGLPLASNVVWEQSFGNKSTKEDKIHHQLECEQLGQLKRSLIANESANYKVIYNESVNSCLAMVLENNSMFNVYFGSVYDLGNLEELLSYVQGTKESVTWGLEGELKGCKVNYHSLKYKKDGQTIEDHVCDDYSYDLKVYDLIREYGFSVP